MKAVWQGIDPASRVERCIVPVSVISTRRFPWTLHWASAACRAAASSKSSAGIVRQNTIALQVVAEAQKRAGSQPLSTWSTARSGLCEKAGVDIDNLLVSQPDYGEQALEITNTLTASGQIDVLVVDWWRHGPEGRAGGEMGDSHMGSRRG